MFFSFFVESLLPVSLADLLELGGNDTGEHWPDSASGDKRFSNASCPKVDVFGRAVKLEEFTCKNGVIQHTCQFIDIPGCGQAAKSAPSVIA